MPIVWQSSVPIENGLAEALACLVQNKGGSYGERSIDKPAQEFTQEDADDDTIAVWWILVKRDWVDFKEYTSQVPREKDGSLKTGVGIPMWVPSVKHFGDKMIERIKQYGREEYDANEMQTAKAELREIVGFTAYSYQKHELRGVE